MALVSTLAAGILGGAVGCFPSAKRVRQAPAEPPAVRRLPESDDDRDPAEAWPGLLAPAEPGEAVFSAAGIGVTREEYDAGLAAFAAATPGLADPEAAWKETLRERLLVLAWLRRGLGDQPEGFEDAARDALRGELAELVVDRETDAAAQVTEEEIRARYERDVATFSEEPRASISMILVPTEQEAAAVNRRLAAGESFAAVASEMSTHSSRSAGGEIQPFVRGTYNEALEDMAFALQPRERGTVATPRGVFVIEKIAEIRGTVTPLEQVRVRIEADIRREKKSRAYHEFLARIQAELGAH